MVCNTSPGPFFGRNEGITYMCRRYLRSPQQRQASKPVGIDWNYRKRNGHSLDGLGSSQCSEWDCLPVAKGGEDCVDLVGNFQKKNSNVSWRCRCEQCPRRTRNQIPTGSAAFLFLFSYNFSFLLCLGSFCRRRSFREYCHKMNSEWGRPFCVLFLSSSFWPMRGHIGRYSGISSPAWHLPLVPVPSVV